MMTCNAKNWELTTDVDRLLAIQPMKLGPKHEPVNHGEALQLFKAVAIDNKINFGKEFGMLSNDSSRFVYVADVKDTIGDLAYTLGFVNYNNMRKAFCGLAGERVFVCSNQRYSGVSDESTKHLSSLKDGLRGKIENIVNFYSQFREKREKEIASLKEARYTDDSVGRAALTFLRKKTFPGATIEKIVNEWDKPSYDEFKDRTAWSFLNATTHVMKSENPLRIAQVSSTLSEMVMAAR